MVGVGQFFIILIENFFVLDSIQLENNLFHLLQILLGDQFCIDLELAIDPPLQVFV